MAKGLPRLHVVDPIAEIRNLCQVAESVVVGIDPGMSGAIAVLPVDPKLVGVVFDMPVQYEISKTVKKGKTITGKRGRYDVHAIIDILSPENFGNAGVTFVVEGATPRPTDTAKTAFSVGMGVGMWPIFFAAYGYAHEIIYPVVWKRQMSLLKQNKGASQQLATRLFPKLSGYFRSNSDDGRAEAVLIAESYLRRLRSGGVASAPQEGTHGQENQD